MLKFEGEGKVKAKGKIGNFKEFSSQLVYTLLELYIMKEKIPPYSISVIYIYSIE